MAQADTVAFIGGGNMAGSLIGGLLAGGFDPTAIRVAEPNAEHRAALANARPGIRVTADNVEAASGADCVVLAVKPQVMAEVAAGLNALPDGSVFLSIAAGVTCTRLATWLGTDRAIVRSMPNTPALIGCGATGAYANPAVEPGQRALADRILHAVGEVVWFDDERALDAVTALSGSGPAYVFLLIEALEAGGIELGLEPDVARRLALLTAHGASRLALKSDDSPGVLRTKVTSPGGTTEQALGVFEKGGLRELVAQAMQAAAQRSRELSGE
ncbi:pyrroline-5-carboxylate reductase [Acidihalobacter aeolianus]|uniref:Pyrroline-5-carboxylate reductase n=2 Tax=Acidihalobacter aeolianus TaxID=2792603 RepID=A0A1D8KCJ4_9GAMM|nr:pyrroline-5-carboxylate reductase [Acidihalobacter aeolianus]AOV18656.1 pyrroline-5-carboxylate reductase [Acidihalobacter aeolianus]